MLRLSETAGWFVGLFSAGLAVIAVGRATAPAYTDGDVADSDFFFPLTLVLAVMAMAGGFRLPTMWGALGLAAVAPYFAYVLGIGYTLTPEQEGFKAVGFVFLLPIAAVPVLGALIGSGLRKRRDARRMSSVPSSK